MVRSETTKRTIELGRLILIIKGKDAGKVAVILNVIDQNRFVVEGKGVNRQLVNQKDIEVTPFVCEEVGLNDSSKVVGAKVEKSKILEQWAASAWAKKVAVRELRANVDDFTRFKLNKLRKTRARAVATRYFQLKNGGAKKATKKPAGKKPAGKAAGAKAAKAK